MASTTPSPTITFQLVNADIVALRRYLGSRRTPLMSKLLGPLFILLVSLTTGVSLLRHRAEGTPGPSFASILALILPIAFFLVILFVLTHSGFGIDPKSAILQHRSEVTLLPDAFSITHGVQTNSTHWSGIEKIEATPTHLFVFTMPQDGFIVPRRAFCSDKAFTAFADYALYRWNEARPQSPPIARV